MVAFYPEGAKGIIASIAVSVEAEEFKTDSETSRR
jgi:hypothetical protein